MSAPALYIRLELEEPPRVYTDAMNEGQRDRLAAWLESCEDIRFLVDHVECVCLTWDKRGDA